MNARKTLIIGLLVFVVMLFWGPIGDGICGLFVSDADLLVGYLFDKGLFALFLLVAISLVGGFKYFGFERGAGWCFLIPAFPFLILGLLVPLAPNATFDIGLPAAIGWILVTLSVGFGEETVFRGILWRAFESRGTLVTAVATSAMFGSLHLVGLFTEIPWQIVVSLAVFAFGGGMMFAAIRLVSGSLLAPITLHFVFDAIAVIAAGGAKEMFDETWTVERLVVPGVLFGLWGLACILFVEHKRSKARLGEQAETAANGPRQESHDRQDEAPSPIASASAIPVDHVHPVQ